MVLLMDGKHSNADQKPDRSDTNGELEVKPLLIEQIAQRLGFERVARAMGKKSLSPYLFIITVLFFNIIVLSYVGKLWTGELQYVQNPGMLILVPGWLLAVWVMLRIKKRYKQTIANLPEPIDRLPHDEGRGDGRVWYHHIFNRLFSLFDIPSKPTHKSDMNWNSIYPNRVLIVLLLGGLIFHFSWWLFDPGAGEAVKSISGEPVALFQFLIFIPLVYYSLGAEFVSLYVGIHVFMPLRIRQTRLIDFTDPFSSGGLSHIGGLLTKSTVLFFVLLSLFATFLTLSEGTGIRRFQLVLLVAATVAGITLFYVPVYWLHIHLLKMKKEKLKHIKRQIEDKGNDNEMFPHTVPETEEVVYEYTHDYIRLTRVESTKEFPVDTSMLQQVAFSIILPYILSFSMDSLIELI